MKRGKDDEKMMGPMFPRLHVNDTEKGGPRAPPRNKMALYEQLSTPSHRLNHGGFPPNSAEVNNLAPAASTSQGSGTGRNSRFSHQVLSSNSTSFHMGDRLHYRQPNDGNSNASSRQLDPRQKLTDEDDFTVPVFSHTFPGKSQNASHQERPTIYDSTRLLYSQQIHNSGDNHENNISGVGTRDANFGIVSRQNNLSDANFSRLSKDDVCLVRETTVLVQKNDNRHGGSNSEVTREIERRNNPELIAVSDSYSGDDLNCRVGAETNRSDDISETSAVDSVTEVSITPDDIVGMIGQKRFWKARRAIVNQQRLFALQVFELHKLIKVQQLIASSPHLLLQNTAYLTKPPSKLSSTKKLQSNAATCQNDSDKQNHEKEHSAENKIGKNGNHPHTGNPTPYPIPADIKMDPQGFHLGNQWLVPIMSPSEGLIYKPYTPPGAIPFNGNFFNPVFAPFAHGYYPMPFMDPNISGSGVEKSGLSGIGANFSGNFPTKKRGPDSQVTKPQASTASSPTKKVGQLLENGQAARVIKVVPHNRRSATESAARIFRSIQAERKRQDSV